MKAHKAKRFSPVEMRLKAHGWDENENGCWIWRGDKTYRGYGRMSVNNKSRLVHRLAYEAWNGKILDGMVIRHTCDTPLCINPQHLLQGTHKDNMKDKYDRGRANMPKGKDHYLIKRKMLDTGAEDLESEES